MPKASWRDKYKGPNKKKKKENTSSKDQFKKWFQGKIKRSKDIKEGNVLPKKGKGKGKGKDDVKGKGKGSDGGRGDGSKGGGSFGDRQQQAREAPASVEGGEQAGIGKEIMERLRATKNRLLLGNAEAARAGAVKAEPGAFRAVVEARAGKGGGSADAKGKGKKGKGKTGKDAEGKVQNCIASVALRTQEEREEVFALNKKIGEHAQSKDLPEAKKVLEDLESRGWANAYTYAAAVNAFCRCSDWQSAESALARGEKSGLLKRGVGAASGVVARTSMLRGYCEVARDLTKARVLLQKMEEQHKVIARPNVRTANTFLRGCLQLGAVSEAEALLKRMEEKWSADEEWRAHGGAPDATSYETVVTLLCQALRHSEATNLARICVKKLGASPGSSAMFVGIARAAAVCGDWDAATTAASKARKMLDAEEQEATSGNSGSIGQGNQGSGGKRGAEKTTADGAARVKSLEIFQTHRRGELLADLKELDTLAKKRGAADITCLYSRTVTFGSSSSSECAPPPSPALAAEEMCKRLSETFGLAASGERLEATKRVFSAAFHGENVTEGSRKRRKNQRRAQAAGRFSGGVARLNLGELFLPVDEVRRPLNLELCSGGGEWALAQAKRDSGSCWVACELRFDRSNRCFQRMALRRLAGPNGNLGLIVGDAEEALGKRLQPASCARVFINHPEPPHQTDLEAAASSAPLSHLLTADFLQNACASVLKPGGTLTICTDSPEYGKWLRRTLAAPPLNEVFEDAIKSGDKEKDVSKKLRLRMEPPPLEVCGAEYSGEAGASYFQRLKQSERGSRGQDDESRYFLCLRRKE